MKTRFVLFAMGAVFSLLSQCALAAKPWYPHGTDMCAQYVVSMTGHETAKKLVTPLKDPAISKYVHDFNTENGTNDKGGLALLGLLGYCTSHGAMRLAEVNARDVLEDVRAANQPSNNLGDLEAQWRDWYKKTTDWCGSNAQCMATTVKTSEDGLACARGNSEACDRKVADAASLDAWNSQHGAGSAGQPAQSSLQACLQNAVRIVASHCSGCTGDVLLETTRTLQQATCGYSALQPTAQPADTGISTCRTDPSPGGGWVTTCSQY